MAVAGINAGPGLTTSHDATVTPAMQGLTGAQPAAPAAAPAPATVAPAAPTPDVIPPGSVIGGGTATSVSQALLGPSIIGGHVGKDFEIEANGQVVTGGGAALMGGGGSSIGGLACER